MILPVTVCIILLSAMVYLALSRKSDFKVRVAALAAMAAMIITVIICLFRIFMAPAAAAAKAQPYPDMPAVETAPPPNAMGLVLFIIILIALFLVVLFLSLREQRRVANENDGLKNKLGF